MTLKKFIFLGGTLIAMWSIVSHFTESVIACPLGDPPHFKLVGRLQASNGDMKAGSLGYSVPCVFDWNEDGKKDLLVGAADIAGGVTGNVFLYLNSGTNEAPVFTTSTKIQADGADLDVGFS